MAHQNTVIFHCTPFLFFILYKVSSPRTYYNVWLFIFRLGTLKPDRFVLTMNPVRSIYDPKLLPTNFDSESKWPGQMSNIQDQGWCGSSWAISTAAVASDRWMMIIEFLVQQKNTIPFPFRFAIVSKGLEKVTLSAQHLLSCDNRGQQSCKGGHLDRAWSFVRKLG